MGYYIDLAAISIEAYKSILKETDLLPSWKILGADIDKNMDAILRKDITNLAMLIGAIKTKSKVQEFAGRSGLSIEYLTVLSRVIRGYHPKPNRFQDFPNMPSEIPAKLASLGIKNTLHLYTYVLTPEKRKAFSRKSGISIAQIDWLTRLTDLSRIKWVNHTFAYVLCEAGYHSARDVAHADPQEMYERIKKLNSERMFYKGNIGAKDMARCVEAAKWLEFEIVY
jgi:hypothetical protein